MEVSMKKTLFVLTVLALLWLAPAAHERRSASIAPFGAGDACAQTGTCKSSVFDICFVAGNAYYERVWIGEDGDEQLE